MTAQKVISYRTSLVALLCSATLSAQQIIVGPNVHVSKDRANLGHSEVWGAADLANPNRLIACSMTQTRKQPVYVSHDRGRTWKLTLDGVVDVSAKGMRGGDQVCEFGPGGRAYVFWLELSNPEGKYSLKSHTVFYRSSDSGLTWEKEPARFGFVERAGFAVDNTGGKYHGRIYVVGLAPLRGMDAGRGASSLVLYRSSDGGRTFAGPVIRSDGDIGPIAGSSALLSDGTFIVSVQLRPGKLRQDSKSDGSVVVFRSIDGGETLEPATGVADYYDTPGVFPIPTLAADGGSASFKDRVYTVWQDTRDGHSRLLLAFSSDMGKTWSAPRLVSDAISKRKQDLLYPAIRVNKDGVVGVVWYDRRDRTREDEYDLRFAASLDGGETFTPSVRVNDHIAPVNEKDLRVEAIGPDGHSRWRTAVGSSAGVKLDFHFAVHDQSVGETIGLATGADGVFHAFFIDIRTNVSQLWTAPVTVEGVVAPHGAPALASLIDVSEHVTVRTSAVALDRQKGTLTPTAHVKNTSTSSLRGPLKLRLVAVEPDTLPNARSVRTPGAENGVDGIGAVWDMTAQLGDGVLSPGEESQGRAIQIASDHLHFNGQGTSWEQASLVFRVLAAGVGKDK